MSEDQEVVSLDDANSVRSKNWTVKNVSLETRLRAIACAKKLGEPMHQAADRAFKLLEAQLAGNQVLPPGPTRANSMNVEGQPDGHLGALPALVQMAAILTPEGKRTEVAAVARKVVLLELQAYARRLDVRPPELADVARLESRDA